ncbi:hypothetical protein BCR37DRAFT_383825 [Protomyces lactucae-debilis]|uniref:Uncharacterized protein n=1 Tax=Protomyces lactucae-debilis TaxID=2754530 RepID=A0A1Y2EWV2_PROLT|nr:uncharacterized protein BCR37DRAFT_383825 [Protomyces lactucae-debilis]ORY75744.1 hypothetical protein BCR37DRAFT_383825 [Protomyces lactucae-debilis]
MNWQWGMASSRAETQGQASLYALAIQVFGKRQSARFWACGKRESLNDDELDQWRDEENHDTAYNRDSCLPGLLEQGMKLASSLPRQVLDTQQNQLHHLQPLPQKRRHQLQCLLKQVGKALVTIVCGIVVLMITPVFKLFVIERSPTS